MKVDPEHYSINSSFLFLRLILLSFEMGRSIVYVYTTVPATEVLQSFIQYTVAIISGLCAMAIAPVNGYTHYDKKTY
jgi:hypothetical protein